MTGILYVPSYNSNTGSRTKILDHLMNIWQPDYINESLYDNESGKLYFNSYKLCLDHYVTVYLNFY